MKNLILRVVLILVIIGSCKAPVEKDFSEIDDLITTTDSLFNVAKVNFELVSENFYSLIEDSAKLDSIAKFLSIPDSIGIYQYIEMGINDINQMISHTQEEIYFVRENLLSVKNEFLENQISQDEYMNELIESEELINFLSERVDSNIYLIKLKYNILVDLPNDSIP